MFVIRKPESSNKTIRMNNDLIEKLESIAAEKQISFNQLVVQCCEYAIANLKSENGESAADNADKEN
ncbi:MAG: toxin-antitoxin system HicB family antitoxin [Clostridiaceae bacterium]|nr:toxin-antitoxin system HicB family antitoxin [Clostridiaceae bacterium]